MFRTRTTVRNPAGQCILQATLDSAIAVLALLLAVVVPCLPRPVVAADAPAATSCADLAKVASGGWSSDEISAICSDTTLDAHCTPAALQDQLAAHDAQKAVVEAACKAMKATVAKAKPETETSGLLTPSVGDALQVYSKVELDAWKVERNAVATKPTKLPVDYSVDVIGISSRWKPADPQATDQEQYVEINTGCQWYGFILSPRRCGWTRPKKVDGQVDSDTRYLVRKSDLDDQNNVNGTYLTYGVLYFPFKYRHYDHNFDTTSQNISGSLGIYHKGSSFALDLVTFLGLTSIDVQANASDPKATGLSKSAAAMSMGAGAIFKRINNTHWSIGAFVGWDHLAGGQGSQWRYDRKSWYSLGLGYDWEAGSK